MTASGQQMAASTLTTRSALNALAQQVSARNVVFGLPAQNGANVLYAQRLALSAIIYGSAMGSR